MNVLALSHRPPRPVLFTPAPVFAFDKAGFEAWLQTARPGSLIEYHRGHLCIDRQQKFDAPDNAPENKVRAALNDLATRALRASDRGLVHLVQRRHGREDFSYLAIKARPPVKAGHIKNLSKERRT